MSSPYLARCRPSFTRLYGSKTLFLYLTPQRQLLRTIETIGLRDVFETPGISLSKDLG